MFRICYAGGETLPLDDDFTEEMARKAYEASWLEADGFENPTAIPMRLERVVVVDGKEVVTTIIDESKKKSVPAPV